jgi:uncharacterized Zn finger protein
MKITKAQLKKLTDSRSWKRGVDYHRQGNVLSLLEDKDTVTGKVRGTRNYNVRLWVKDGELDGLCDCPMGDAGVFCKHCVAVGLTYLEGRVDSISEGSTEQKTRKSKPALTLEDVRRYLSQEEKDVLIEIITKQITKDDHLRNQLMMKTARFSQKGVELETFKQVINEATNTDGFVDYHSAHDFARGIDNVIDCMKELLEDGFSQEVMELTEHALRRAEKALGEMDDSDGYMGDILEQLQEIHHKACVKARPDPEALAKRLFKWELTTDWDTFHEAAETYADVLGKKGLVVYGKLAEAEWAKLPAIGPEQLKRAYDHDRFRITSIMESLACVDGDVESLVAVKSKDLSIAYHFLEIAQVYKDAGKPDKALEWAEKGLKAFPENTDSRLREFLANEYHRCRRHDEAMQLIWLNFAGQHGLENYKGLKEHAERVKEWPKWREQALGHIRAIIADAKEHKPRSCGYRTNDQYHSTLVEIFIWEKNIEAAWQEAQTGGCGDHLWMQLAQLREKEHPADSFGVYRSQVEPLVQQTNNHSYREAIRLIKKIRELMKNLNKEKEFAEYVSSLKAKYRPKRNFIKLLNRIR